MELQWPKEHSGFSSVLNVYGARLFGQGRVLKSQLGGDLAHIVFVMVELLVKLP